MGEKIFSAWPFSHNRSCKISVIDHFSFHLKNQMVLIFSFIREKWYHREDALVHGVFIISPLCEYSIWGLWVLFIQVKSYRCAFFDKNSACFWVELFSIVLNISLDNHFCSLSRFISISMCCLIISSHFSFPYFTKISSMCMVIIVWWFMLSGFLSLIFSCIHDT